MGKQTAIHARMEREQPALYLNSPVRGKRIVNPQQRAVILAEPHEGAAELMDFARKAHSYSNRTLVRGGQGNPGNLRGGK